MIFGHCHFRSIFKVWKKKEKKKSPREEIIAKDFEQYNDRVYNMQKLAGTEVLGVQTRVENANILNGKKIITYFSGVLDPFAAIATSRTT